VFTAALGVLSDNTTTTTTTIREFYMIMFLKDVIAYVCNVQYLLPIVFCGAMWLKKLCIFVMIRIQTSSAVV